MLCSVLHILPDSDRPADIIATLIDALPPGSYLTASHGTAEHAPETAGIERDAREADLTFRLRNSDEFARMAFTGLELIPPGVVPVSEWRPDPGKKLPSPAEVSMYGAVARKP